MEQHSIVAKFVNQEHAEAAIRKLGFLRGDCFRLERVAEEPGASDLYEMADTLGSVETKTGDEGNCCDGVFTLSANVPLLAADQALSVIRDAGGEVI